MTDFAARLERMPDHAPFGMGLSSAGAGNSAVYLYNPYDGSAGFSKEKHQKIVDDPIAALVYPLKMERARSSLSDTGEFFGSLNGCRRFAAAGLRRHGKEGCSKK